MAPSVGAAMKLAQVAEGSTLRCFMLWRDVRRIGDRFAVRIQKFRSAWAFANADLALARHLGSSRQIDDHGCDTTGSSDRKWRSPSSAPFSGAVEGALRQH
jgi:hypothetical protein